MKQAPTVDRLSARLTSWAWAADAIGAFVLAAATSIAVDQGEDGPRPVLPRGISSDPSVVAGLPLPQVASPVPPLPPAAPRPPSADSWLPPGRRGDVPYFNLVEQVGHVQTWQVVLAALTALPLVARRWRPLAAYWAVFVTTLVFHLSVTAVDAAAFTFISGLIAAYSAAMYSQHRAWAVASLLVGAVGVAASHETTVPKIDPIYLPFLVLVPIGLAANAVHTQKQRARVHAADQVAAGQLAVDHERARIARELHDVVTHNVSVMVIQAGAARKVLDTAPERARDALLAVEASGRAAMDELRHVMGLLTMSGDGDGDSDDLAATADLAPQPGLDQLASLARRIRDTGISVGLTTTGTPRPLPAGEDLAGYRVVQEALTNTVKHAAGASVQITVDYAPDEVRVEVTDTGGTAAVPAVAGSGRGLVGLRERLAVYGGTLDAGARPTGGYRVRAVIPTGVPVNGAADAVAADAVASGAAAADAAVADAAPPERP